jgi:tetratricopeptide (TPR) repeat protein
MKLETLSIMDIGDGGAKADKFVRDIRLLTKGLEDEPKNDRYMFYLANSYRDNNNKREAIECYKKRISMGGWDEEVWNCNYHIGNCYEALGEFEHAIYYWMEAFNYRPSRAESIYKIVKHYRTHSKYNIALKFCLIGKSIPFPKSDLLFIEKNVYEYLFDYELSIIGYYTKYPMNHTMMTNLLAIGYCFDNVMSNYSFFINTLKDISGSLIKNFNQSMEMEVNGKKNKFVSSTPSIVRKGKRVEDGYVMNLRMVNYRVSNTGAYTLENNDGIVITLNKCLHLDKDLNIIKEKIFNIGDCSNPYIGYEDVRLLEGGDSSRSDGNFVYQGMVQESETKNLTIGVGEYKIASDDLELVKYKSPHNRRCEKNWALFRKSDSIGGDNGIYAIYEYNPLTIIKFDSGNVKVVSKDDDIPLIFKHFRGSTNGVHVDDELWFVVHIVSVVANQPRRYYHAIVVFDKETMKYKRMSYLFKFDNKQSIEYCLGMVIEKENILMSYSIFDNSSYVGVYDRVEFCKRIGL